jgi:hypothetical protein
VALSTDWERQCRQPVVDLALTAPAAHNPAVSAYALPLGAAPQLLATAGMRPGSRSGPTTPVLEATA